MDSASEPVPLNFRAPLDDFSVRLNTTSEEIKSLAGDLEQAPWALCKMLCTVGDLRHEVHLLEEKMRKVEFHLRSWSSQVRDTLTNIENDKRNKILRAGNPSGLLTPAETAKKLGLSRSSLALLTRDERFPQPIHVSPRKIAYIALDIEKWIEGSS